MTTVLDAPRPGHVPADRVYDFDIYHFDVQDAEYQLALKKLNTDGAPQTFWTPRNSGHWIVTHADQMDRVLGDAEFFSSRQLGVPKREGGMQLIPLTVDPPDHTKYRNLLAPALSPKAVKYLGEGARALAIELIEGFRAKGECEFITDFAQHLPIAIFMSLVDLPEEDRSLLTGWADAAIRGDDPEKSMQAHMGLAGYGMQKVMERRANPGSDLISTIATAEVEGRLLTDEELLGMIMLLLLAGLDTVASMLGFFARFLALNPDRRQELIDDPSLIPNATEELLRRYPIAILGREVVKDCELDGVRMKTGDMVIVPTPLYGLDEQRFPNPAEVDFHRPKPIHGTFGTGIHRCMGSMLARTELRIFLEEWLKRIPDFQIRPGADVKVAARSVATITSLPLVWETA